jgi:hypothetical protein
MLVVKPHFRSPVPFSLLAQSLELEQEPVVVKPTGEICSTSVVRPKSCVCPKERTFILDCSLSTVCRWRWWCL